MDAQIREWYTIAGNWLGHVAATGAAYDLFALHNVGPETGHILWAKPYAEGGLVGGALESHRPFVSMWERYFLVSTISY